MNSSKKSRYPFSLLLSVLLLTSQPLHAQEGVAAAASSEAPESALPEAAAPPAVDTAAPVTSEVPALPDEVIATPAPTAEVDAQTAVQLGTAVPSRDPQGLEYEAHRLLAVASVLADERRIPSRSRLDFYVRQTGLGRGLIEALQYAFDDAPLQTVSLDAVHAQALAASGNVYRLARIPLTDGAQRLRVVLRLNRGTDSAVKELTAELSLVGKAGPIELVAQLEVGTIGGQSLRLQPWRVRDQPGGQLLGLDLDSLLAVAGRYLPGDDNDPALGHARQLLKLDDVSGALVELLSIAERRRLPNGSLPPFEAPYWLETARLLRQQGLLDRAQQICDDLSSRRAIRTEIAIERLAIGEARLAIGDLAGAERQLALSKAHLPEYRLPDLRSATGMLQLAQQRDREARKTLNARTPDSVEAFRYMSSSIEAVRATAYSRYNLAIATLRSGDENTALSWLDLLGRTDSKDPEMLALRDKANLALGWHFLERKQGRTALGALGRVRSEGLASNRALLGVGWAQLAPAGERLKRTPLGDNSARAPDQINDLPAPVRNSLERLRVLEPEVSGSSIGPSSFEREDPPKDRREGLLRALQIWTLLIDRDERDPAVQEAKLAVAYAYDQLRDGGAARAAYGVAVESLRKIDAAIEGEVAFASSGDLRSTMMTMRDQTTLFEMLDKVHLPPETSTFPLYAQLDRLQQRNRLQQALVEARQQLEQPSETGPAASPELLARLAGFETWLTRQRTTIANDAESNIKARLTTRRDTTREYLKTALLSLARLEDTPDYGSRAAEPAPDAPSCSGNTCP